MDRSETTTAEQLVIRETLEQKSLQSRNMTHQFAGQASVLKQLPVIR